MDVKTTETAAFDAHFSVINTLTPMLGRNPTVAEVAGVLAKAFGDATAIAGLKATPDGDVVVGEINAAAQQAYDEMVKTIISGSCAGSA